MLPQGIRDELQKETEYRRQLLEANELDGSEPMATFLQHASIIVRGPGKDGADSSIVHDGQIPLLSRVEVEWKGGKWYNGVVTNFNNATGLHTVKYDDGDLRQYKMSEKNFRVVDSSIYTSSIAEHRQVGAQKRQAANRAHRWQEEAAVQKEESLARELAQAEARAEGWEEEEQARLAAELGLPPQVRTPAASAGRTSYSTSGKKGRASVATSKSTSSPRSGKSDSRQYWKQGKEHGSRQSKQSGASNAASASRAKNFRRANGSASHTSRSALSSPSPRPPVTITRAALTTFYREYNPSKIAHVAQIMATFSPEDLVSQRI
jgi:hypothetical protein